MPDLLYYSYMPMQTHEIFLHNCNYILHELFKKYISSMVKSYIKTTALSTKVHVEGSEIVHIKNWSIVYVIWYQLTNILTNPTSNINMQNPENEQNTIWSFGPILQDDYFKVISSYDTLQHLNDVCKSRWIAQARYLWWFEKLFLKQ